MSPHRTLPQQPSLSHLKKQAKVLLKAHAARDPEVVPRLRGYVPKLANASDADVLSALFSLRDAQRVIACEYGFFNWDVLAAYVTAEELMRGASRARREGRTDDAHRDLVEAVALYRRASANPGLVQALRALSEVERDLGRNDEALKLYEEGVAVSRAEGDSLPLAHTIRHLGQLHHDAGRVGEAERCYCEALELYRGHESTPPLDVANAVRPLAILKEEAGETDDARRLWREARDLYEACGVQAGVDECSERLTQLSSARP